MHHAFFLPSFPQLAHPGDSSASRALRRGNSDRTAPIRGRAVAPFTRTDTCARLHALQHLQRVRGKERDAKGQLHDHRNGRAEVESDRRTRALAERQVAEQTCARVNLWWDGVRTVGGRKLARVVEGARAAG